MSNFIKDTYGKNGEFRATQDVSAYLDYASKSRAATKSMFANQKENYRSFAIIPDIVAVDIKTKFGIDVHDSQNSTEELQKIKSIVIQNYPQLLTGSIIKNPKGR